MPKTEKKSAKKSSAKKATGNNSKSPKSTAATRKKSGGAKRKPNPAFMKPMQPSPELAAIVGPKPLPRTEVTKKVWDYIKRNKLQDTKNKRQINADDKLESVFGGKAQVSMFEMTKLINEHLS